MLDPRVAMACAVSGATALLPSVCSGQIIATDIATNPAYADGWQPGDNGGSGFTAWSMFGTANTAVQHVMDSTSPFNQLGLAWTLYNPNGPNPVGGSSNPPEGGTDISQAGRGFAPLGIGYTVSTVIDNPSERQFFRGYTVRFNTGGNNTDAASTAESRLRIGTFEDFSNGAWFVTGTGGNPSLFDTDTDAGMRIDFTLTGADTFLLTLTPLDNPLLAFTKAGTLDGPPGSPIDWIEFEFYNTDSDSNPTVASNPQATDFYVRSITIVPEPSTWAVMGLGLGGLLFLRRRK